jgi:hypothetical protein
MISMRISSSGSTDGRPVGAVERCQVWPNLAEVDEAVDRAEHVVGGHPLLKRELVKQSTLIDLPLTHHHLHSRYDDWSESVNRPDATDFFNKIHSAAEISGGATADPSMGPAPN